MTDDAYEYANLAKHVQFMLDQDFNDDKRGLVPTGGNLEQFDIQWKKTIIRKMLTYVSTKGKFKYILPGVPAKQVMNKQSDYEHYFKDATFHQIQRLLEYFQAKLKEEVDWLDLEERCDL